MKYLLNHLLFIVILAGSTQLVGQRGESDIVGKKDTFKIQHWLELARDNMNKDKELALIYIDSSLRLSKEKDIQYLLGHTFHEIGDYYNGYGNLDTALLYYDSALVIYKKIDLNSHITKTLNNMGLAKISQAKYDEGLNLLFESLSIKEKVQDSLGIPFAFNSIGEAYMLKGNYDQAENFFLKAIDGFEQVNRPLFLNMVNLNLAGLLFTKGDYKKSLAPTLEAKAFFEAEGYIREVALAQNILGSIYMTDSLFEKSLDAFVLSKNGLEKANDNYSLVDVYLNISRVSSMLEEYDEALVNAEKALETARLISSDGLAASAMLRISEIYKEKGQYRQALNFREKYEALNDTIFSEESEQRIAELEKKYETRLREQELKELTAKNEMNELRVKKQRNQQYGLIGFAALTLLISGLVFNQYRTNKKTNKVLTEKNNIIAKSLTEKEVLLRETHHRVKNNMQLVASLLNLQSRYVKDEKTLEVLNEGKYRINSMALLHQKLYQEDNLKGVNMRSFIENLLDSLLFSFKMDRNTVKVETNIEDIMLDIDTATPIGLIINELITNAIKYAFAGKEGGKLEISLAEKNEQLTLIVKDNGPGLKDGFKIDESKQFGFKLIKSLAQKIEAELSLENNNGAVVQLNILKYQKA